MLRIPAPLWLTVTCVALRAQDPTVGPVETVERDDRVDRVERVETTSFLERSRLTGDWGGLRTQLEDQGIEIGGRALIDWSAAWRGGVRNRDTVRSLVDVYLLLDLGALAGVPRTTVFLDGQNQVGRDASFDVGDFQVFSNIDGPNRTQLAEAWIESWLGDEALRFKVGKVDANSEFAYLEAASDFAQSSAGFSPTIVAFPSYPEPAFGINVFAYPTANGYVGAAVYDGSFADGVPTGKLGPKNFFSDDESDAYFWIGEAGLRWDGARAGIGGWYHGARFDRFDGGSERGTQGLFAFAEVEVYSADARSEGALPPRISLFGAAGLADQDVSPAAGHVLVGATWRGVLDARPEDTLGLLLSHVDLSDDPAAGFARDETAFELYYRFRATSFVSLQPGLHYIVDPSGRTDIDDALVGMLRIAIDF